MKTGRWTLAWTTAVALGGCGCPNFRDAVSTWTNGMGDNSGHLRTYVRYLANDCSEPSDRTIRLQTAAGLPCTLDEDAGRSIAASASAACSCAHDAERCEAWATAVLGGPYPACASSEAPTLPPR